MSESAPQPQPVDYSLLGEEHVRRYRETDGEVGYIWNGVPTLLLTTTGRKTGLERTAPLIFARDGDRCIVVASYGGMPQHPVWYLNLTADPKVSVQIRGKRFAAAARTATPDEKPRLWDIVRAQWPNYDVYQSRTDREIPVVVLDPIAGADA
jgi:deazaflavin-dependent oxidoreductase (nitroreductase family)